MDMQFMRQIIIYKINIQLSKTKNIMHCKSEVVNQRTKDTMAKRKHSKEQTMIYKTQKFEYRTTGTPLKTMGERRCPEGSAVPSPHVLHFGVTVKLHEHPLI